MAERVTDRGGVDVFALNAALAFAWAFVTGHFTIFNLIIGFALGFIALYIPRRMWGDVKYFRRLWKIVRLIGVFLYELAVSAFSVAWLVLKPDMRFRSAIVAIPLEAETDFEIMLFANLISLTPGTLSMDVSDDRETLYVHVMDCSDPEADKQAMKTAFERNIREALS